jgi:mannose-6-phosphate isomerase-like protein (cupin superfamily)
MEVVRWNTKRKPTELELRKSREREGPRCELHSDPPKIKYVRHRLDFDDFIVIVSRQMAIVTDKHEWLMTPGDRLDISANTVHRVEVVGKEEIRYLSAASKRYRDAANTLRSNVRILYPPEQFLHDNNLFNLLRSIATESESEFC